jgi:hypothetical protein
MSGRRARICRGGLATIGVQGSSGEGGYGGQAVAGKGVHLGNRLEEVGFLTQLRRIIAAGSYESFSRRVFTLPGTTFR